MVNDVKSIGMVLELEELELAEALLKFRGPIRGDSEGRVERGIDVWKELMMSVSVEKDCLP